MIDLHTHTLHSDGTTTPKENVRLASSAGLTGLALTDHDNLDGWAEAEQACAEHGVEFVPGIELSTEHGKLSVHVLGYWVDPADADLLAECYRLRNERFLRAEAIVDKLRGLGADVTFDAVAANAGDAPIARPHIAKAMLDAGVVGELQDAYDHYLADGGPAYVPKYALAPHEGVALIRAAGGVAVLAHPGLSERRDAGVTPEVFERLVAAGLAGVEADHPSHDDTMQREWREAAAREDLLVTGASDFHGLNKDIVLGERTTPPEVVEALRARMPR